VAGVDQAYAAYSVVGDVEIFAELIDDLEADVAMLVQEMQQVFAADLGDLEGLQNLGGDLVDATGESGAEAEDFTGGGDAEEDAGAAFGTEGEADASIAEEKDAAGGLTFTKENGAAGPALKRLDAVEFLESIRRQIAENTVRALPAIETALQHKILS